MYITKNKRKILEGNITHEKSIWKDIPLLIKIILIILLEILIFVWILGYLVFFIRTINIPKN